MMERRARKLSIFPDGSLQATAVDNAGSTAATNLIINDRTQSDSADLQSAVSRHVGQLSK